MNEKLELKKIIAVVDVESLRLVRNVTNFGFMRFYKREMNSGEGFVRIREKEYIELKGNKREKLFKW